MQRSYDRQMSAAEFTAWFEIMKADRGWLLQDVQRELGLNPRTIRKYREDGAPLHIALACAALAHNLKPWPKA